MRMKSMLLPSLVALTLFGTGTSGMAEDLMTQKYEDLASTQADNRVFDAEVIVGLTDDKLVFYVFISGIRYGFFRSAQFTLDVAEERPPEARGGPDAAAYWLNRRTLRLGPVWPLDPVNFHELHIVGDANDDPAGLALSDGPVVSHAATVIDVVGPYVLSSWSAEGRLAIQLLNADDGGVLLETRGFEFRLYPRSPKLRFEDGRLMVDSACEIENAEENAQVVFGSIFRCPCPEKDGFCERPFEYSIGTRD